MIRTTLQAQNGAQPTAIPEYHTDRHIFWPRYYAMAMVGLLSAYIICSVHFGHYFGFGDTFDYYPDQVDEMLNKLNESLENEETAKSSLMNSTEESNLLNNTVKPANLSEAQILFDKIEPMYLETKLDIAKIINQYNSIDNVFKVIQLNQTSIMVNISQINNAIKQNNQGQDYMTKKLVEIYDRQDNMTRQISENKQAINKLVANHVRFESLLSQILNNQDKILAQSNIEEETGSNIEEENSEDPDCQSSESEWSDNRSKKQTKYGSGQNKMKNRHKF